MTLDKALEIAIEALAEKEWAHIQSGKRGKEAAAELNALIDAKVKLIDFREEF